MANGKWISIFDDYAHHPTEIKATLAAFKEKSPGKPLICVFQAHQAARLKLLFKDFKNAFKKADSVIVLPTYEVAGREKNPNHHLSKKLSRAIGATYITNPKKELKSALKALITNYHCTIVMMGAGDIVNYTNLLIGKNKIKISPIRHKPSAIKHPLILIAGGQDKNLNYTPLAQAIKKSENVKQIILFGENKRKIQCELQNKNNRLRITKVENLQQTVKTAYQKAISYKPYAVVLFSPASASFDMFKDYKDRGRQFKDIVRKLKI